MKKNLCIVVMLTGLMLWGCNQEKKQAEAPLPETLPAMGQAMDKAKEATKAVAQRVEKTTEAIEEKGEQQIAAVEKKVTTTAAPVVAKVVETAAPVKAAASKLTTTVESVTIDNKNGKVILPHKQHADAFGCTVCHGDKKPGPHKLGKDAAHALCQGCHKEKKSGPTTCNQCHQKKGKAIEGC